MRNKHTLNAGECPEQAPYTPSDVYMHMTWLALQDAEREGRTEDAEAYRASWLRMQVSR